MAAKPTLASQDLTYGSWHAAITKVNVVDLGPMLVEQPAAGASVPVGITLVTFTLDGYKNPAASTGLDAVKRANFTFEVCSDPGNDQYLFPTNWWPSGTHYYGLAQGTNRGLFTYFLNVHALSDKPVLMTFALGAVADTAEGMSDAEVWAQVRSPSLLHHTSCASRAWA